MNKVFYPTNIGGMSINWVDYQGSEKNSKKKSELLIDNVATMSNENNGKDIYVNFFEEVESSVYINLSGENEPSNDSKEDVKYKTFLRINITEAIKHDLEWMEMNNKSINDSNDSHYINMDSLSITHINVQDDFKFIRIHYEFCQNHFACSRSRRQMVGAVYRLDSITSSDTTELIAFAWDGPIVFW